MAKSKPLLFGLVFGVLVIGSVVGLRRGSAPTSPPISVVRETDEYVVVERGGEQGRYEKAFTFGFEEPNLRNWFGDRGLTTMTLLSPRMPSDEEYTALSDSIINDGADFVDNRVVAERDRVAVGHGAARFEAMAPSADMVTSKADVRMVRLWFVDGDDLWFRGRFLLDSGVPYSIVDIEDTNQRGSPGVRVVIDDGRFLGVELKHGAKPRLRQTETEVPDGRWFELMLHIGFDTDAGVVQVWQDGTLVLDGEMPTMPTRDALMNSVELGITATDTATVLLADDIAISHQAMLP